MKSYGKDGYEPKVAIYDALHMLLRDEQSAMRKLFEALDGLGAAYINIDCGEHCIIVGAKDFSDWLGDNYDPEDD